MTMTWDDLPDEWQEFVISQDEFRKRLVDFAAQWGRVREPDYTQWHYEIVSRNNNISDIYFFIPEDAV